MTYKIRKNIKNVRILGKNFVNYNRNKGKIIINNKVFPLKDVIPIKNFNNYNNSKKFEIKIKIIMHEKIFNLSSMFKQCKTLKSFSRLSLFKTEKKFLNNSINIKNNPNISSYEFDYEEDISILNNYISINNISSCYSYSHTFGNEISTKDDIKTLFTLQNQSKINTNYITDLSYMFYNCISLKYLSGITNWNTSNVTNMSYMFYNCKTLKSLPDISEWNTNNVNNFSYMFYNCKVLTINNLFLISEYTDIKNMFTLCKIPKSSLNKFLPKKIILISTNKSNYDNKDYNENRNIIREIKEVITNEGYPNVSRKIKFEVK